jgi:predicted enzyme related to lactoylglutathione lyase
MLMGPRVARRRRCTSAGGGRVLDDRARSLDVVGAIQPHAESKRRGRPAAVARRLSEPSRIPCARVTTVKVCIDVADLDEASAFYCQALRCTEVGRTSRTVKLTAGGNELYLILRAEGSAPFRAATEGRSFARHWTPVHLDFSVEDVGWSTSEITRLGGLVEDQESGDWGSLTRCADPFGNGFCLVST